MTLHITTFTPFHIITVSDRLLSCGSDIHVELADDQDKYFALFCKDARVVVSFTGHAGRPSYAGDGSYRLVDSTIDWLTDLASKAPSKDLNSHVNRLRDEAQLYVSNLANGGASVPLGIQVCGWKSETQFNCVIENCMDENFMWGAASDSITTRSKIFSQWSPNDEAHILILGPQRNIALSESKEHGILKRAAMTNDPRAIFDASVALIRAVALKNPTRVGTNCSGIRMSRNNKFNEIYEDRNSSRRVAPNVVTPVGSITNVRSTGKEPIPATELKKLMVPKKAKKAVEQISFWYRCLERLRMLHNQEAEKLGPKTSKSKRELDAWVQKKREFETWQHENFSPINLSVCIKINEVKSILSAKSPEVYTDEFFHALKHEQRSSTTWDEFIDLGDLELFAPDARV
jgi:hypothetical protein